MTNLSAMAGDAALALGAHRRGVQRLRSGRLITGGADLGGRAPRSSAAGVAQGCASTVAMAAVLMLSLAGAGATRSHLIPAPELWAPMDADPAAMGFSFAGLTFTALPAERFLAGGGGVRCGTGDERCFLIESREQVTIFFSKGRTGVEPKSPRWPRSSLLLGWLVFCSICTVLAEDGAWPIAPRMMTQGRVIDESSARRSRHRYARLARRHLALGTPELVSGVRCVATLRRRHCGRLSFRRGRAKRPGLHCRRLGAPTNWQRHDGANTFDFHPHQHG